MTVNYTIVTDPDGTMHLRPIGPFENTERPPAECETRFVPFHIKGEARKLPDSAQVARLVEKARRLESDESWFPADEMASEFILAAIRIRTLEVLISEESIERLATDIAIACVDCSDDVRKPRHAAMVRLGERLRNPLPNDLRFARASQ